MTTLIKANIGGKAFATDAEPMAVQLSFDAEGGGDVFGQDGLDNENRAVTASAPPRGATISGKVIIAELQCQLVNLANAVNRLDYHTASKLGSKVRALMACVDEHVSRLPPGVERAALVARPSALICGAELLLLAAPRISSGSFDRSTVADAQEEHRWIQERNSGGSVSLVYDRGALIFHTSQPLEDSEPNKGMDDVETSHMASGGGGRDSDHALAFTSTGLQLWTTG